MASALYPFALHQSLYAVEDGCGHRALRVSLDSIREKELRWVDLQAVVRQRRDTHLGLGEATLFPAPPLTLHCPVEDAREFTSELLNEVPVLPFRGNREIEG